MEASPYAAIEPGGKAIALGHLEGELDALIAGAGWAGTDATLGRARALLEQVRTAPLQPWPDGAHEGWVAVRSPEGSERTQVVCSKERAGALVSGTWSSGTWSDVVVLAVDAVVAASPSPWGETWVGKDEALSPDDKAHVEKLVKLQREALERAASSEAQRAAPHAWTCGACGWENGLDDPACRMCLSPRGATNFPSERNAAAALPADLVAKEVRPGAAIQLPGDLRTLLAIFARKAAAEGATHAAAAQAKRKRTAHPKGRERRCPSCGARVTEAARFCEQCGAKQAE
jgi:hypothetical protein